MSSCKNASKKRKVFDDTETLIILQTWATDKIQKLFSSLTRHNIIYDLIARKLKECGYDTTATEVKSKINNLKTEYRKIKPKSGDSTPDWPYYSILHEILGQRDISNNDLLEDSFIDDESEKNTDNRSETIDNPEGNESDNENSDVEEDADASCREQTDNIESKKSSDSQQLLAKPKIRKISRPPRRSFSKEDTLIQSLIQTEKSFQQRLDMIREQEKRNEERDDIVAHSMTRFLNAFAALAEHSISQGTSAAFNEMPYWNNIIAKENVAKSASKKCHQNMTASQSIKLPTIASSTVTSGTYNKCQQKYNQVHTIEDMDSSQEIIDENDSQQISDLLVDDINFSQHFPEFICNGSPAEQVESDIVDKELQENIPNENEETNSKQPILNFPKCVLKENQSPHKSDNIIRDPLNKEKSANMLKSPFNKILPTIRKEVKCKNILVTKTNCGLNIKKY